MTSDGVPEVAPAAPQTTAGQGSAAHLPDRLTAFERYFLLEDRGSHAMWVSIDVVHEGRFVRSALDAAFQRAVERHPRLHSPIHQRSRWGRAQPIDRGVVWFEGEFDGGREVQLRPAKGTNIQVYVLEQGPFSYLILRFHHAAADGTGGMAFLADLYRAYRLELGLESVPLRLRGRTGETRGEEVDEPASLSESLPFFLRRPAVISGSAEGRESDTSGDDEIADLPRGSFQMVEARIPRHARAALSAQAHHMGASLNDALLAAWIRTLARWTSRGNDPWDSDGWIRVLVPHDLREAATPDALQGTRTGYWFLDRRVRQSEDAGDLLHGVAAETGEVRRRGLNRLFSAGLAAVDRIPGLLWVLTRRRSSFASSVLSAPRGLGIRVAVRALGAGEGIPPIVTASGAGPLRPGTSSNLTVLRMYGELILTLRFDPAMLSAADSRALLGRFVDELHALLGEEVVLAEDFRVRAREKALGPRPNGDSDAQPERLV